LDNDFFYNLVESVLHEDYNLPKDDKDADPLADTKSDKAQVDDKPPVYDKASVDDKPPTDDNNSDTMYDDNADLADDTVDTNDVSTGDTNSDTMYDDNADLADDNSMDADPMSAGDNTTTEPDNSEDTEAIPDESNTSDQILNITDDSRNLLSLKLFQDYRKLYLFVSDSMQSLTGSPIPNMEFQVVKDQMIDKLAVLLSTMNDYMRFLYIKKSYEINLKNFVTFSVSYKRLLKTISLDSNIITYK
jgi:hypothetical protein